MTNMKDKLMRLFFKKNKDGCFHYDLIISLGESCYASQELRFCGLQKKAYPFDWMGGIDWDGKILPEAGFLGLESKIKLLLCDCKNILNLEDLYECTPNPKYPPHNCRLMKNKRTGLLCIHHFPKDVSIEEHYPIVSEKYKKRVERLYWRIDNSKRILFVFFANRTLPKELIKWTYSMLHKKFPKKSIDLLLPQNIPSYGATEITKKITKHIHQYFYRLYFPSQNNEHIFNRVAMRKILSNYKLDDNFGDTL